MTFLEVYAGLHKTVRNLGSHSRFSLPRADSCPCLICRPSRSILSAEAGSTGTGLTHRRSPATSPATQASRHQPRDTVHRQSRARQPLSRRPRALLPRSTSPRSTISRRRSRGSCATSMSFGGQSARSRRPRPPCRPRRLRLRANTCVILEVVGSFALLLLLIEPSPLFTFRTRPSIGSSASRSI